MDEQPEESLETNSELDSLEGNDTVVESTPTPTSNITPAPAAEAPVSPTIEPTEADEPAAEQIDPPIIAPQPPGLKPPRFVGIKRLLGGFNIYLLLFILLLVVACAVIGIAYFYNKNNSTSQSISSQSLSQATLKQLASSDATVGSPKQVLNVQSSAIFAGKVLIRDSLEVAGGIQVGGSLSLSGISVSGSSTLDDVKIAKNLSVSGNTSVAGQFTVQQGLAVSGNGSFSGNLSAAQISASNLQLSGDLTLTRHLAAGGSTPSRSNGSALGSGGTTSVSGSDTSGSVTINTGSSPAAGCFITVTFAQKFNSVPHILLTPIGSSSAGLAYYATRNTSSFSICTISPAPGSASFGFDYFVVD